MNEIRKFFSWFLHGEDKNVIEKRKRSYYTRLADELFNIVSRDGCNFVTFDNVRITTDYEKNDLVGILNNLRNQYVNDKMNEA